MKRVVLVFIGAVALSGCADIAAWTNPPPAPKPIEDVSPVDLLVRLPVPGDRRTVADAATYLLGPTPYHLLLGGPFCPPEAGEIAAKPISPLASKPAITSIKRALVLVAGSRARLLIDEDAKSITFAYVSDTQ
jgi:hypothetical protein